MKLKFKGNEQKEKINWEIDQKLAYMAKIGPGKEYQNCIKELKQLYKLKEQMSFGHKLKKALPWVKVFVAGFSTIAVPVTLATLAYRNSEEQGKLKNGDVWREAIQNQERPTNKM